MLTKFRKILKKFGYHFAIRYFYLCDLYSYFKLPKNTARLIVLQRIELTSPFLRKLRKLFGRYVFSSFITKYFLNPKHIGKKYYQIMLKEFLSIEKFSPIISSNLLFISFIAALLVPFLIITFYSLRNSLR